MGEKVGLENLVMKSVSKGIVRNDRNEEIARNQTSALMDQLRVGGRKRRERMRKEREVGEGEGEGGDCEKRPE